MPTLSERTSQLESDARDAKSSLDAVALQAEDFAQFRKDVGVSQALLTTEVAVEKTRLNALTDRYGELHKRVEAWEGRLWVGAVALISALITAVLGLVIALIRK